MLQLLYYYSNIIININKYYNEMIIPTNDTIDADYLSRSRKKERRKKPAVMVARRIFS